MAPPLVHELSALCTIASLAYVCRSLERQSLTERHRLSSLLVVFLSGLICLGASYVSKWLPRLDGRLNAASRNVRPGLLSTIESNDDISKDTGSHAPARPRRYSIPVLAALLIIRLELFNYVNSNQQCSAPGIESWLCLLLIGHDIITTRRSWSIPVTSELDDPWRSVFDDLRDWLTGPRAAVVLFTTGAFMFSSGTYIAANQTIKSTYICLAPVDSRWRIVLSQYVGLLFDTVIAVLSWRALVWTRNLSQRLRMISNILFTSSAFASILWLASGLFGETALSSSGLRFLYGLDVLMDSVAFATLITGWSIWTCETSPVTSTGVATFVSGIWQASMNVCSLGDWTQLSRSASLGPLWLLTFGSCLFIYAHNIRSVIFLKRILFVASMGAVLIAATIFAVVQPLEQFDKRHPINDMIYEARTIHDRWLVKATTSTTLATAVMTYRERHGGRSPPPAFGHWYQYASGSAIIDEYPQIDADLDVFRSLSPSALRERVQFALSNAGVGSITVADGQVTMSEVGNEFKDFNLEELVGMIGKFSKHLPDMVLPINLNISPRVLPPWADTQANNPGYLLSMAKIISRGFENDSIPAIGKLDSRFAEKAGNDRSWHQTWSREFSQMHAEACPSTSRVQTSPYWDIALFCSACVKEYSRGQLMDDWQKSLDVCSQPDLDHLHGFVMTNPSMPPIRRLIPLFGPSKINGFRDILLPLLPSPPEKIDDGEPFPKRKDTLFWRGKLGGHVISEQAMRGSHKLRLLHLLKKADVRDRITMIIPVPGTDNRFKSESVSVMEANRDLSFNVGIDDFSACMGQNCDIIKNVYGQPVQTENPSHYRYVLLTDEDDGPSNSTMEMLRSQSLPFISTIFKTWFSDRLTPWLHFVPIDTRYQALHTTLLYFTGTANKAKMNGINTYLTGSSTDGEWIAQQGRRWAEKALGRKDMEIYLFRLLLEWGRLIDDRRDEIGYRKLANGEFQGDEWTHHHSIS